MQSLNNFVAFGQEEVVGGAVELGNMLNHLEEVDWNDAQKESQNQDWGEFFQMEQERGDGLAAPIQNNQGNYSNELIVNKPIRFSYLQSANDGLLSSSEEEPCSFDSSRSGLAQGKVREDPIMTCDTKFQSKSAQKSLCKYFSEINPLRSMPSYRKTQFQGENIGVKEFQDASTCYCGINKKKTMKKCKQEIGLNCKKVKAGEENLQSQDRYFEMYFGGNKVNEFGALSMLKKQIEKNKRIEKELEKKNRENQQLRNLICKIKKIGSDKLMNLKNSTHNGDSKNKEGRKEWSKKQSLSNKFEQVSPKSIKNFIKKSTKKINEKDGFIGFKYKKQLKVFKKSVNKMKLKLNNMQTLIQNLEIKNNRIKSLSVCKSNKKINGFNVRLQTENNNMKF